MNASAQRNQLNEVADVQPSVGSVFSLPGGHWPKHGKITTDDDTLAITGDRELDLNRKIGQPVEHACGRFAHRFAIPADARPAKVSAVFKNGVLMVHLAKSAVSLSPTALASCSFRTLRFNRGDRFNQPERGPKSSCGELCHIF